MTRRQLMKAIIAIAVLFIPSKAKASTPLTIGSILTASFPAVVKDMCVGWGPQVIAVSPRHWKRESEITIPIVWGQSDQDRNQTKIQKITLVSSLLENAIASANDLVGTRRVQYWSFDPVKQFRDGYFGVMLRLEVQNGY